jgi:hypothetical protein
MTADGLPQMALAPKASIGEIGKPEVNQLVLSPADEPFSRVVSIGA